MVREGRPRGGDLNCRVHAVLRGRVRVNGAPGGEPSPSPPPWPRRPRRTRAPRRRRWIRRPPRSRAPMTRSRKPLAPSSGGTQGRTAAEPRAGRRRMPPCSGARVSARNPCARLPGRRRDAEGGRAVHRLARDGRGKSAQRKKRAGGHGGGRSEHANDAALDQVASAAASALGAIKQQAMSSAATLVGTTRAEPLPSLRS